MKLWLIIYAGTQIGGFAGPLPYDETECKARAAGMIAARDTAIQSGKSIDGQDINPSDLEKVKAMRFECEFRDVRPVLPVNS